MDLDAVDAGFLHAHGRIAELAGELVNLVDGDGARRLAGIGRAHEGRSDQARRAGHVERHVGGVEQLRHDLGAVLVDGGGQLLPAGDEGVVIAAHVAGQVGVGGLHGHDLSDDEAHAALGTRGVMVDECVGHIAVIGQVGGHGRHEHAVLDLLRADLDGAEQHRVSLGFHESPPLSRSEELAVYCRNYCSARGRTQTVLLRMGGLARPRRIPALDAGMSMVCAGLPMVDAGMSMVCAGLPMVDVGLPMKTRLLRLSNGRKP